MSKERDKEVKRKLEGLKSSPADRLALKKAAEKSTKAKDKTRAR